MLRSRASSAPDDRDPQWALKPAPVPSASAPDALESAQPIPLPDVDPEGYAEEAQRFAATLSTGRNKLAMDFSLESVDRLDRFIAKRGKVASDGFVIGLGCYLGEVIRSQCGGSWRADGALTFDSGVSEAFPIQVANDRCRGLSTAPSYGELRQFVSSIVTVCRAELVSEPEVDRGPNEVGETPK